MEPGKGAKSRGKGSIIVISAPSGTGKSSLVRRLLASVPNLAFSVSYTTRSPRKGEQDGREYIFVSPQRFQRLIAKGTLAEWAEVHGHFYGTPWEQLRRAQREGRDVLLDIDVQGYRQVRRKLPETIGIFLLPPSRQELERRLRRRHADDPDTIRRRLRAARKEIACWKDYDYVVVNERLPEAVKALAAIVTAARFRRTNQQACVRQISKTFGG